jgi:hypothetical protein
MAVPIFIIMPTAVLFFRGGGFTSVVIYFLGKWE